MLKKDITFTNWDGDTVTETHYFNISRTEIIEMELEFEGGLEVGLRKLIDEEDQLKIFKKFKELIIKSYGRRVENSFVKDEEMGKIFAGSLACDELIVGFFTDVENAAEFVRGILPRDLERGLETQDVPAAPLTPPAPPSV